jgi:hypothetical protein
MPIVLLVLSLWMYNIFVFLSVRELWSCIHPAGETEFSETEMAEFHNSLEAHIRYCNETAGGTHKVTRQLGAHLM